MHENKQIFKEQILEFLDNRPTPQSFAAVCERFKANKGDVSEILEDALANGEIFRTKKEKYTSLRHAGLIRGRAIVRSGAPVFVRPDEGDRDFYLSDGDWVMNGDILLIKPTETGERPRASLQMVVRRAVTQMPAVIEVDIRPAKAKKKQKQPPKPHITALAYPLDSRIGDPIRLRTKSIEGVQSGDIAMVRMIKYPEPNQEALAEISEVFGREDDLEALAQAILASHDIPRYFDADVLDEAILLPQGISDEDLQGREDLREWITFTIDGADAKDFDDAVSLEKCGGIWRLGVHIADVSHYVRHNTAIDRAAQERGTSVYLPGLTLPMLPDQLCNDRCSLLPDEDRLTLSAIIDIAADGHVQDYRIVPSVIHSHARLTYDQVNRMLAGESDHAVPQEICEILCEMNSLKDRLAGMRARRGSIDLDLPEAHIVVGEHMLPKAVELRNRGESERMIEQFMLTANECVAEYARHLELPFLYRVHAEPDSERLHSVNDQLSAIGCGLRLDAAPRPADVAAVLNAIADHPSAPDVRRSLLLAMSKARYAATPDGHYALAAEDYCHFTSPIRRYPDLFVHRMLKRHLAGLPQAKLDVHALGQLCSERENLAAQAEREADHMLMAAYMARHIGRRYDARISRIGKGAMFVALENTIEGAIPAQYMPERYVLDEQRRSATFIHSGRTLQLGDIVRVRVENAIPATSEIEFSLVLED